jgi:hypothetical protein
VEEAGEQVDMRLLAFCVMPNHWHLAHGTVGTGPLYQGRFKSFPIQEDEHFFTVCRYVERNALRANLVTSAEQWRWSSLWHRVNRSAAVTLADWPLRPGQNWLGIHVTSPWPPKTPPSRPVNGRTTRQIDTNETRPPTPFLDTNETRPRFPPFPTQNDPPVSPAPVRAKLVGELIQVGVRLPAKPV